VPGASYVLVAFRDTSIAFGLSRYPPGFTAASGRSGLRVLTRPGSQPVSMFPSPRGTPRSDRRRSSMSTATRRPHSWMWRRAVAHSHHEHGSSGTLLDIPPQELLAASAQRSDPAGERLPTPRFLSSGLLNEALCGPRSQCPPELWYAMRG